MRCKDCGLFFTIPQYKSWLSENVYDTLYEAEGSTTALPEPDELERFKANVFAGSDKDSIEVIHALQRACPSGSNLLELGCSWGYFLFQAKKAGLEAAGIEISTRRREFGRKLLGVSIAGCFDEIAGRQFDIIYTAHVLEHFTDISTVFEALATHLSEQGLIFIEVPNFDLEQFGPRILSMVGAIHPLGFDSCFFRRNLAKHGLEVMGIFEAWRDMPNRPVERSAKDVIIVQACRANARITC
jgi:SAM-dependent methyltransferase